MNDQRERILFLLESHSSELASIGKTLHDDIAQLLSAAGLQLDLLRMDLEAKTPELAAKMEEVQDILEVVVNKVRELSQRLGPVRVERIGLRQALDWLVGAKRSDFSGTIRLLYDSSTVTPADRAYPYYRVAELALENAIRHAQASLIEVIAKPAKNGTTLEVRDDGIGFDPEAERRNSRGLGLAHMDYVARAAGLVVSVSRNQNQKGMVVLLRPQKIEPGGPESQYTIG